MNHSLTIGVGMTTIGSMAVRVLLTSHQGIDIELQDIVPHILSVVHLHLEVLVVAMLDNTFFIRIRDIGRISGVLGASADVQVVVMLETGLLGDSSQPVGVVAEIFLCRLPIDYIMGIHEVHLLAPL